MQILGRGEGWIFIGSIVNEYRTQINEADRVMNIMIELGFMVYSEKMSTAHWQVVIIRARADPVLGDLRACDGFNSHPSPLR